MMKNSILLIPGFLMVLHVNLRAQTLTADQTEYLETLIESIIEQEEREPDLSGVFDQLAYYMQQPLNLNLATADELHALLFLNDYQVLSILDYRSRHGGFTSLFELAYVPGFRQQDIENLRVFTYCGPSEGKDVSLGKALRYSKQLVILRYQRVLEDREGYLAVPDSVLTENPGKSRKLGSADKLYARYTLQASDRIKAGFIAEKDPGEEFFSGSNAAGFDLYSGFVSYSGPQNNLSVIIGDYQLEFGQGLLLSTAYSFGKTSYPGNLSKNSGGFRGNTSADEYKYLRGAAVQGRRGNFSLGLFVSRRMLDASLSDSTHYTTIRATGYHTTPTEIKYEQNLRMTTFGGSLRYEANRLKLGFNSYYAQGSLNMLNNETLYRAFTPAGNDFQGLSADYRYLAKKFQFFGETAWDGTTMSTLNGMLFYLDPGKTIGLLHRYYSPEYFSLYANAFGENSSPANEKGFYLSTNLEFPGLYLRAYGDVFSFPWLKYQVNAPSEGREIFFEAGKNTQKSRYYLRFRYKQKAENKTGPEPVKKIDRFESSSLRLNYSGNYFDRLKLQTRAEGKHFYSNEEKHYYGFLIFQDVGVENQEENLALKLRLAYFNAPQYDTRIYAYENDLRFAYTSHMHYGKGWRYYLLVNYKPVERISLNFKIAQSLFPGVKEIGSGLNRIEGNHQTEVKFQILISI